MTRVRRIARERRSWRAGSRVPLVRIAPEGSRHALAWIAPERKSVRLRRPRKRVRSFGHGNCTRLHRSSPGAPPPRAPRPRRLPRRARGLRPPPPMGGGRVRVAVRLPAPRARALEGRRVLPEVRGGARPALPRARRAAARREAVPHDRRGGGARAHAREPRPRAPAVLRAVEARGAGARRG